MTSKQQAHYDTLLTSAHRDYTIDLHRYSYFKVHERALSEDLVQDTFMKTWNYLARGGKIETMKSFLYHILNNLIIDQYRKQKHQTTSLDILIDQGFEPGTDDSHILFDIFDGKAASLLIANLPKIYRDVMRMRYIDDLSLKEMSTLTGQTKNTIAVKLHRGLDKLKILHSLLPTPLSLIPA